MYLDKSINSGLITESNSNCKNNSSIWGDYNNDGYIDLLTVGISQFDVTSVPRLYKNTINGFVEMKGILPIQQADAATWGDFDNDGDLDLVIAGRSFISSSPFTSILRNDNGKFIDINANLIGVQSGILEWFDFDNDGHLDLILCGIYNQNNKII